METDQMAEEEPILQLIEVEKDYVCFDTEQPTNAKQSLKVKQKSQFSGEKIAWRIRTNAPTRYLVYPNNGIFSDLQQTQSFTIELVDNRFNPHHRLVVQAIRFHSDEDLKTIWKSNRVKDPQMFQAIPLELSTTSMNIERTWQFAEEENEIKMSPTLLSILGESSTSNTNRIEELEALCNMLKSDISRIQSNIQHTFRVKEILNQQTEQRNQLAANLSKTLRSKEKEQQKLSADIDKLHREMRKERQQSASDDSNPKCTIS